MKRFLCPEGRQEEDHHEPWQSSGDPAGISASGLAQGNAEEENGRNRERAGNSRRKRIRAESQDEAMSWEGGDPMDTQEDGQLQDPGD
eukprot:1448945-Heterocapsa_arctica.AAC.1